VYNRTGLEGERHGAVPMLRGAALAYARRGVPVFPCEPGGKRPLTRNGFWDATTEARRIEAWWARWPAANVGVPTGRRSGLLVLDADPRDGGLDSLTLLEREWGPLPGTARARTGGGGVHVFFAYPAGETVRNSAGLLGAGLDVRGEGGYVVVPPSRTRGAYEWTDRSPPAGPGWLLARLRERAGEETLF
jgi:Bifunctional DNA primase/polymerase, N-terminal